MIEVLVRTLKVMATVVTGGLAAVLAQVTLPDPGTVGNVGLVGVLALIIGRYTFRQLEDYRQDLQQANERVDRLQKDLHEQGQAKARLEREKREVEEYAHRLRLWALAQGATTAELPAEPASIQDPL